MLLATLLLVAAEPQEVRVLGPGKPNGQTPATLVVEPAAMLVVACDTDADGRTTRPELDACVAHSFTRSGAASRTIGYIDYGLWQQTWLGDQGALPSPLEVDRDGDNRISLDELQAQFAKLFARFDKDGDGAVTRAEALTVRATAATGRDRPPPRKGERIPGTRPDTPPPGQ